MFETPVQKSEKDPKKEMLQNAINDALESLNHYKEMPDTELIPDEEHTYQSQDPKEVEAKRANKYRKVAFGTISNYLYLIIINLENKSDWNTKLMTISDEIAHAPRTTKDVIDRFDVLAHNIIKAGQEELNKK